MDNIKKSFEVTFHYSGTKENWAHDDLKKELIAHDGQKVSVLRPLTADEADLFDVGPMYKIRFGDGYETDAFGDELVREDHDPTVESISSQGLSSALSLLYTHLDEISEEAQRVISALEHIYFQKRGDDNTIKLCDLASYTAASLWTGKSDICDVLNEGDYDDVLEKLKLFNEDGGEECYNKDFIDAINKNIDWNHVVASGILSGNHIIEDAIEATLKKLKNKTAEISISRAQFETAMKYLRNEEHLEEGENISFTADFGDGMTMDISVWGNKDKNKPAWADAVLFDHGDAITCGLGEDLLAPWVLNDLNEIRYEARIQIEN